RTALDRVLLRDGGAAFAARGRGDLDRGRAARGAQRERRVLAEVAGHRGTRADRRGGGDGRRLLLVAPASQHAQRGDHGDRGVAGRQHQGTRLPARDVAEVDGGGHAALHMQRLVPGRGDLTGGRGQAHLQVGVGVAGYEGDQAYVRGVLG